MIEPDSVHTSRDRLIEEYDWCRPHGKFSSHQGRIKREIEGTATGLIDISSSSCFNMTPAAAREFGEWIIKMCDHFETEEIARIGKTL